MSPDKPTILFVDDEENVLRGIRRMMRSKRNEWDTLFANGGEEALSVLKVRHVDVVVSDMRMPGMDGAELLTRVQKEYSETIRIVLSGYAEKEAILRTVGPSHQYLAKPCDQETLINTIQRSLNLRALLGSEALRRLVADMTNMPALPDVFAAILKELEDEYASADSLAETIAQDVGVTTHLMKLTNSAYFGLPMPAKSPKQAINFLGFENVKAIVLLGGVFDQLAKDDRVAKVAKTLSQRSMQLGLLARAIASANGATRDEQDQAYCAGLIAHIGTLLLVANWPEKFNSVVDLVDQERKPISEAETDVFGTTHGTLGAYLLGLWGFNDPIVEAVAFHHNPSECNAATPSILLALHTAQHLLRTRNRAELEESVVDQSLDRTFVEKVSDQTDMSKWIAVYDDVSKDWPDD